MGHNGYDEGFLYKYSNPLNKFELYARGSMQQWVLDDKSNYDILVNKKIGLPQVQNSQNQ